MGVMPAAVEHLDVPAWVPSDRSEGEVDRDVVIVAGMEDQHRSIDGIGCGIELAASCSQADQSGEGREATGSRAALDRRSRARTQPTQVGHPVGAVAPQAGERSASVAGGREEAVGEDECRKPARSLAREPECEDAAHRMPDHDRPGRHLLVRHVECGGGSARERRREHLPEPLEPGTDAVPVRRGPT